MLMITKLMSVVWLAVLLCSGCAFVSIPLGQITQPLKEKTLQGSGKDKILLMDISGIISDTGKRSFSMLDRGPGIVARVKEELDKAAEDKRIKALVLRINSPGGTVTSCDIIYREIRRFKEKKNIPVIACLMDMATSGGYYVAAAADTIIAHPTTITGSIGVIVMKFNVKGLFDKFGIAEETIKSGDKKDLMSPFRGITAEEQKIMQDIIDSLHRQFIKVIDRGRNDLSEDDIAALADGRIYTADQALENKMVDDIGYLSDALEAATKEASLAKARVVVYQRPMAYKNNIYSQASINIFGFGGNTPFGYQPLRVMYLWNP